MIAINHHTTRCIDARQKVADAPVPRHLQFGRDVGQRQQHEGAFVQARVRYGEVRFVDDMIAVQQKIKVERAWTIAHAPHATRARFDIEQCLEKTAW